MRPIVIPSLGKTSCASTSNAQCASRHKCGLALAVHPCCRSCEKSTRGVLGRGTGLCIAGVLCIVERLFREFKRDWGSFKLGDCQDSKGSTRMEILGSGIGDYILEGRSQLNRSPTMEGWSENA